MKKKYFNDLPDEIQVIIKKIIDILNIPEIESVILIGSAARGEMSFYNKKELFVRSDIEFYVVTDKPKKVKIKVSSKIKKLEFQYSKKWPEFHIDIAYMNKSKLSKLNPWIRHFELINNGKILIGEDLIKMYQEIDID